MSYLDLARFCQAVYPETVLAACQRDDVRMFVSDMRISETNHVMVCGVDCHPGDDACHGYCMGNAPMARIWPAPVRVIAFGATHLDKVEDLLRDISALPVLDPAIGHCHEGFLDGARYIALDVVKAIAGKPFILTGHSLGGALALTVGAMLAVRGIVPEQIVTFGAPRAGEADFCACLAEIAVRQYRFGDDIVPTLPFEWTGYRHPRELLAIGATTGNAIADHGIANYIAALEQLPLDSVSAPAGTAVSA